MVESYGLLNDIFPFPSILDAGYPIFNPLHNCLPLVNQHNEDDYIEGKT